MTGRGWVIKTRDDSTKVATKMTEKWSGTQASIITEFIVRVTSNLGLHGPYQSVSSCMCEREQRLDRLRMTGGKAHYSDSKRRAGSGIAQVYK